jgi:glycosyltransferase involved in cell wall biosynthesis
MKIVVSLLNFRPERIGGTETYLRRLIPQLSQLAAQHDLCLLMDRDRAAEGHFPGIDRAVVNMNARRVLLERGLEALTPYRCRAAEKALNRLQPDVVLFPQQSIFPKTVPAPCVLVVHDLYHVLLPQYLSRLQRLVRDRSYGASIARANRIIAISEVTKETVVEHYGVDAGQVALVHHGFEATGQRPVEMDPEVASPYIYYPATTLPHKNHGVLLESIAKLKAAGRFAYQLILSGIQTAHWKTLRRQIHRLGLDETVRHVGYVSYERVRRLYQGAECVVFPTIFEGFGLPVHEAVEARKKIIVSRLEIFRELGVPEQFQIDFSDPGQLDRALRAPGITTLLHRPWTWQEAAAATLDVLVGEGSPAAVDSAESRRRAVSRLLACSHAGS